MSLDEQTRASDRTATQGQTIVNGQAKGGQNAGRSGDSQPPVEEPTLPGIHGYGMSKPIKKRPSSPTSESPAVSETPVSSTPPSSPSPIQTTLNGTHPTKEKAAPTAKPEKKGKPWYNRQAVLDQWAQFGIGLQQIQVKVRLQANNLHILCEGTQSPPLGIIIPRLLRLLAATNLVDLIPPGHPQVYQVYTYGRITGQSRPTWAKLIYLNQLERYLEQLEQIQSRAKTESSDSSVDPAAPKEAQSSSEELTADPALDATIAASVTSSALVISNQSLARQGNGDAIARYLSETLSALDVSVEVTVKAIEYPTGTELEQQQRNRRLCIFCDSAYSPDPALIAEPVTQKLRDLGLENFRDAIVFSRTIGEELVNWKLRIDLTPAEEMLKEWARWGDVQAIVYLLNQLLQEQAITWTASLKESTLHLFCEQTNLSQPNQSASSVIPDRQNILTVVAPLLERIAPQGMLAAALYGQVPQQDAPAWIEWLTLPAAQHPALASSALALAQQGDQPALLFLLHRLINPDLEWWLSTGGLRVQLLRRDELLHIMIDGPTCPMQERVTPEVVKLLRQLRIPQLTGIRLYGRRAGEKRPLWNYGYDFVQRHRLVPEPTPEFAASDAYVGALLLEPGNLSLRTDPTSQDIQSGLSQLTVRLLEGFQTLFTKTTLFTATEPIHSSALALIPSPDDYATPTTEERDLRSVLVWSAIGVLFVIGADRILGELLLAQSRMAEGASLAQTKPAVVSPAPSPQPSSTLTLPKLSLNKSGSKGQTVFNSTGFTQTDMTAIPEPLSSGGPSGVPETQADTLGKSGQFINRPLVQEVPVRYATFNTKQLDRQLALYQQRLLESGPPDILIVGSSRALRGIDPVALQKALAAAGYPNLRVFNFGINGATVQVVNLLVQELLTPEQLPRMIIWADGARAFNSGRVDVTYNGVIVSEGYKQLIQERRSLAGQSGGTSPTLPSNGQPANSSAPNPASDTPTAKSPSASATGYAAVNDRLNQLLASASATYTQRDQLLTFLRDQVAGWLPKPTANPEPNQLTGEPPTAGQANSPKNQRRSAEVSPDSLLQAIDFDGFMPLSVRFNPATYYQRFARVSGDFDSDYEAFQLEGRQAEALNAFVQFLQARNIPLVFVNLPLTEDYLDPVRSEYEQEFEEFILQQAQEKRFVFRNLVDLWPNQPDYFSDPSHLNRYGAYEVSNQLAQDPLITWPQPQKPAK